MSYYPPPLTSAQVGALLAALPVHSVGSVVSGSVSTSAASQAAATSVAGSALVIFAGPSLGLTGTWRSEHLMANSSYPSSGYFVGLYRRIA